MTLRLRHDRKINRRQDGMNLDAEPSPTIMTSGISAFGDYYIEDDGVPMGKRDDAGGARRLTVRAGEPSPEKPVFRVPSMAEIAATPWNGFKVASTFSGCGGSCLGYRMAGFRVVWANEFVPAAQDSYRANMEPGCVLDGRDVQAVKPEDVLAAAGLNEGELDLFDGSPPCQAFSTAGRREKGWGKAKTYEHGARQCNERLFDEYVRLLRGLKPKAFVAENVSGLVKGVAKGMFLEILAALKAAGYRVRCRVLDAQWLGVPQMRQRVIFIGVREDLGLEPAFPKPLPYRYSVRDALPHIGEVTHNTGGQFPVRKNDGNHPMDCIPSSADSCHFKVESLPPSRRKIGAYNLIEIKPYLPCGTVTIGSPGNDLAVPYGNGRRKFTIAELKRVCAFPDDFALTGSYAQQWARLGNSVPPVMMFHIASAIRDGVLKKTPPESP